MLKARKIIYFIVMMVLSIGFSTAHSSSQPTDFETIKAEFKNNRAWGMLTSIDLHDCNPKKVRSEADIKSYVKELCKIIDAKRFGDTVVVNFGEDERIAGYSMTQLIETSLISGHFVNANNYIYMDVFSCKPYDPAKVIEFTKQFFEAKEASSNILIRR